MTIPPASRLRRPVLIFALVLASLVLWPLSLRAAEEPQVPERSARQLLEDGGLCGAVIICLSVVALAFVIEHAISIRKSRLIPPTVLEELDTKIRARKIDDAIKICQEPENQSLLTGVVQAGLQRYKSSEFGFAEYRSAVEEAGEEETAKLYRKTEVLAVIGAIAPMLGLLGTVEGMIEAFNTIAAMGGAAKPAHLANSISKALVTTLEGLLVAIPTLTALSYFRTRIDSLVAETGKRVEQILMPLGRMGGAGMAPPAPEPVADARFPVAQPFQAGTRPPSTPGSGGVNPPSRR